MKSSVAILGMLVTGVLFSTAGAGLALQEWRQRRGVPVRHADAHADLRLHADAGNVTAARTRQRRRRRLCGEAGVLPAEAENAPASAPRAPPASQPEAASCTGPSRADTQPERQAAAAAETRQLPFTGFAAIPVLLGGLALLTGGLVLRRRTRAALVYSTRNPARRVTSRRRAAVFAAARSRTSARARGSSGFSRSASAAYGRASSPDTP